MHYPIIFLPYEICIINPILQMIKLMFRNIKWEK